LKGKTSVIPEKRVVAELRKTSSRELRKNVEEERIPTRIAEKMADDENYGKQLKKASSELKRVS